MKAAVLQHQFLILGAYTGALSLMINVLRNLLLLKITEWKWVKSRLTLSVILLMLMAVTIYTWEGWLSLLPLLSVGITSIGYWTNNAQKIRLSQMFGSPCTLLYDALIHSWGGVLNESIALVSILAVRKNMRSVRRIPYSIISVDHHFSRISYPVSSSII